MKKMTKVLALGLSAAMVLGMAACSSSSSSSAAPETTAPTETEAAETGEATETESEAGGATEDTPLVVGYSNFNEKFSPFFSETAYDQDVYAMTQLGLLNSDRQGAIIYKGIEGETIAYNGTDYTYYGPADLEVTENEDGTVFYDFTLREDLVFSDGEPLTVDDIIFSMYVLSDPTYDGSSSLFSSPIQGMTEYRSGMQTLLSLLLAAGKDNTDFTNWDEATQTKFWEDYEAGAVTFVNEIKDYLVALGYNKEEDTWDVVMANWGYEVPADATELDIFNTMLEAYGGDLNSMISTETAGSAITDLFSEYESYTKGIATGEDVPNISGIQKIDDYHLRIVATEVDATMIYQLAVSIAPMHYYGDASLYDYDNNSFGFTKGDLSIVRSKTTQPMGAGPYKFVKYEDGVVSFEANDLYFKGAPKTKYVQFRESNDDDKLNGIANKMIDITDPSWSKDTAKAVAQQNSNGEISGDVITTSLVDNLGYGYIGINAENVSVGGESGSDASKNLRKAFATVFSVYRDAAINTYYGDAASVIQYPISNTSWAAPQPTDEGYQIAFSTDVEGNPIYTSDMSEEDKYAAALEAALGFFEAAGFTVEDGKVTAAPEGAKLDYTFMIPGDGTGNHPAFNIIADASEAFATIGVTLTIQDLTNSSDLWDALSAGTGEMWAAAWGASQDPDMYQIYFSGKFSDAKEGGSNYMYKIADEELDTLIMAARKSTDQNYRKAVYKECLDIIIDWACEVPTYQRQNAITFSTERVNLDTVTPDITTFYGWLNEIENIELN
ncbi:MAG: ABC transporter substrate-binding protein [Lachnospiraceae bacterium]|nr:ABC transporter substrate-binding protein [Lachnospiraceae bacterium]